MKSTARHNAREFAVQAIYSWQLSGNSISDIKLEFLSKQDISNIDVIYFHDLLNGVSSNVLELDKKMAPYLSRKLKELGQIEKVVLRLAMFELCYRDDIPYKVSINEAIELSKVFGSKDSYKFINGVLDKIVNIMYRK
ncbi:MAG: transcription antitermination factor NusB [Arsenophonus endosymbiont of Ceratovacuna japonica]